MEGLSAALVRKGIDVSVVTSYRLGGEGKSETLPNGVKLFRVRSLLDHRLFGVLGLNVANFSTLSYCRHLGLLKGSDVVHVFAASLVPVGPMKDSLPPTLCYFPHFDRPQSVADFFYVSYIDFLLYLLCQSCDIITAGVPSGSSQLKEFMEFFHVPLEKIRFVYEGVDPEKFHPRINATKIREKFGDHMVLYAGPFIPRKGLVYLINAVPIVVKEVPEAKFVFIGRGEQKEYLQSLARRLGVGDHVVFEGFVPEVDLPKYYGAASAFSFPSLREGYPLVCLEAMACGTPVVGTKLGTIAEIVGESGILVNERDSAGLAEALLSVLINSSLRKSLSEKAARNVQTRFTWDKVVEPLIEIYKEAVELRNRGR